MIDGLQDKHCESVAEAYIYEPFDSGYDEVYRGEVIRDAVVGYERQVAASDRGKKPLYRPREWKQEERLKEKHLKKSAWFRPAFFTSTPEVSYQEGSGRYWSKRC